MPKTCPACGGALCEICGGCINHGECSCSNNPSAKIEYLIARCDRLRAALEEIENIGAEKQPTDSVALEVGHIANNALVIDDKYEEEHRG